MKKVIAILMLFAVLLGTVAKDMPISKMIKNNYALNDDSSKEDSKDSEGDTKDLNGKESFDKFHASHPDFAFNDHILNTLFSRVSVHRNDIENPYLESISLPPEA